MALGLAATNNGFKNTVPGQPIHDDFSDDYGNIAGHSEREYEVFYYGTPVLIVSIDVRVTTGTNNGVSNKLCRCGGAGRLQQVFILCGYTVVAGMFSTNSFQCLLRHSSII